MLDGTLSTAKMTIFIGLASAKAPLEPEELACDSAFVNIEADSRSSSSIARPITLSMVSVMLAISGPELSRPRTLSVLQVVSSNYGLSIFTLLIEAAKVEFCNMRAFPPVLDGKWTVSEALYCATPFASSFFASSGVYSATLGV